MLFPRGKVAAKIAVYGQPVSLKFAQPVGDKTQLRQQLGLAMDRPAILLVGGGEGGGQLRAIARAIAQTASETQLMIVTGRNAALHTELAAIRWEIPTKLYGFVENMPELMHAADLLVTKAGPGTISEALIARLPMILADFIPGQETGNVRYIEENKAGLLIKNPMEIADTVRAWASPGNPTMAALARNAARLAHPRASLLTAEDLCYLLEHGAAIEHTLDKKNERVTVQPKEKIALTAHYSTLKGTP